MIYIIESGKYFKIGYTKTDFVSKRSKAYNTHNPDWRVVDIVDGDMMLESFLHKKLKKYKYRGEWFKKFKNWYMFITNLIEHNRSKTTQNYTPYGADSLGHLTLEKALNSTIDSNSLRLLAYIISLYKNRLEKGDVLDYVELCPSYLGRSLFENKFDVVRSILDLTSKDIIRPYNKSKNLYSLNPVLNNLI